MNAPDTPLFVKTRDFLLWLIQHTEWFPKNLRHSYTHKLETLALEFQEALLMANTVRGQQRCEWLSQRVIRGGTWNYNSANCRAANRNANPPTNSRVRFQRRRQKTSSDVG